MIDTLLRRTDLRFWLPLLILPLFSCDESLPPREDPQDLLSGSIVPSYTYAEDNQLTVQLVVKNEFDETLQGTALFTGSIQIVRERDPSYRKTIQVTAANILQAPGYNTSTRVLTLDAGQSVSVQVKWNFIDDLNRDLRDTTAIHQGRFTYVTDPTCPQIGGRKIARSEKFFISGSLLVFERTGDVRAGPLAFSLCHIDSWVLPRDCPPISPVTACNLIQ